MTRFLKAALLSVALVSPATAQLTGSRNVALMSNPQPANTGRISDVWGYFDSATSREYEILLATNGVYIFNATDPSNPALVTTYPSSQFGWSNSWWKDAQTYGHHLYIGSEGGRGIAVIDLADPENPNFLGMALTAQVSRSHNIAIDPASGIGATTGGVLFDLSANPAVPAFTGSIGTGHDLEIRRGRAYIATFSRMVTVDVSALPTLTTLGSLSISACHSAWPTRDDRFVCNTSETTGPGLTIVDNTNPARPRILSSWSLGGIIHNAMVRDRMVHASYYVSGYRLVDISDPAQPLEIGSYDSSSFASGFNGHWGVYGLQPSGVVYASDIQNGLLILKPRGTSTEYGAATPGSVEPTIHTKGAAFLGNQNFALQIDGAGAGQNAYFLLGSARQDAPVLGIRILVDTAAPVGSLATRTADADGRATWQLPVPNDPALDGLVLHAQGITADAGGPNGLAATAGKSFELFPR